MAAVLEWGQQYPKTAGLLSMMGLVYGFKKVKQLLATPKDLRGKIVVITGGAAGLGLLIAFKLVNKGCTVLIWDVNKKAIDDINARYSTNDRVNAAFVDVTNKQSVDREAQRILDQYGRCDILVNNAGVVAGKSLFDLTERDIRRTFEVKYIKQIGLRIQKTD